MSGPLASGGGRRGIDPALLDAKADKTAVAASLATKADATALAAKADSATVNTALAAKADASALAAKADSATVNTALAAKAAQSAVDAVAAGLSGKADFAYVDQKVAEGGGGGGTPVVRRDVSVTVAGVDGKDPDAKRPNRRDPTPKKFTVNLGRSFTIARIETSAPARVRLYVTPQHAAKQAEIWRKRTKKPAGDAGLICDVATTARAKAAALSPAAEGIDLKVPANGVITGLITNLSTADTSVAIVITVIPKES